MAIRKIGIASRTYRHVNRYRQILAVLFKYGFGGLIDQLRIGQYIEIGLQMVYRERRHHVEKLTAYERVRMALEELGPTFIKLGQVLSTRPDLVPVELAEELSKLQQHVPPFAASEARATIEAELDRSVDQVFSRFDERPIAAASIGQVHRAALLDGEEVVVKVRRPNIEQKIEVDLEILLHLATLVERHVEELRVYRPSRIVEEFQRVIEQELDYRIEATQLERFASQFLDDTRVYVPKVYRAYTTERVLTLEHIHVIPVHDVGALRAAGLNPRKLARRGAHLTLRQIFVHGFFHADPHPGNIFALPGNVVCWLDFGMMGRLRRQEREEFADLIYAVGQREAPNATLALLRLTEHDETFDPDLRQLERDVAELIDLHVPTKLGELDFGRMLRELLDLVGRHGLFIPPDLVMMMKAAATAEQVVRRLDPNLQMIDIAKPYVRKVKLNRYRPRRVLRDIMETGGELMYLAREVPGSVRDLLKQAKRGEFRIGFEHRGLDKMLETHERVANRLSFAIVVAALIVASSLIVQAGIPPTWYEIPVVGLIGYIVAGAMGFLLLISILRHGQL